MLRYGRINEVDENAGKARVLFDDEIVSDWLPVLVPKAATDSYFFAPEVGEQVACLMDAQSENGVILGAMYNAKTKPVEAGKGIASVVFADGTKVAYNAAKRELTIKAENVKIDGLLLVTGDVKAGYTIDGAPNVSLLTHLHPGVNTPPTPKP